MNVAEETRLEFTKQSGARTRIGWDALQLEIFPSAGHDLRVEPESGGTADFSSFAPGYLPLLGSWVDEKLQTPVSPAGPTRVPLRTW